MDTFVFGHKNPDTDSVASAIALSYLKNGTGYDTMPGVLGELNNESKFVLSYFNIPEPQLINNVKTQVMDLDYERIEPIPLNTSIRQAYRIMDENNIKTLPIVDEHNHLLGIITMKDIAMGLIKGDFYSLDTYLDNIVKDLDGEILSKGNDRVKGRIRVLALYEESLRGIIQKGDIIIVGDRYAVIEQAIRADVQLILITGNKKIPQKYIDEASAKSIGIVKVPMDTYTVSKLICQCNTVESIMKSKNIIKFYEKEYLEDIQEEMIHTNYRYFPVVDENQLFLGFIGRKHIMTPNKKKVILVDHNEYDQSVEGLHEAEILEIVDHHKIGDISTSMPISFRNMPVGSTCTIVYNMFREIGIEIPYDIAGLMLSGIISDTLLFKSPTTTNMDRKAADELNEIVRLDLESYSMNMFRAGTSLEGYSIGEIFYRDFKDFHMEMGRVGIGQVFTLDIDSVFSRKEEFINFIDKVYTDKEYYLTLLLITDIIKEGSYLLFRSSNSSIITLSFNVEACQGVFVKDLVSRKKQVIPRIAEAMRMLK
ncbi:putative manganese-dependent inorganic diphosphatase [Lutispora thermophila]|uniref:inorganic diphosphatase n=1 Tax=Lutispora thermophila DSM 19022 TaxID=1122184 RepID=A0A1M6E2A7_9FIRM|nr:putative manganese-dependent inorganic diphosphatase [Lutispora thermophila]SHI79525.1 manganese-dependent inorganic pyrophosphatase [Lutispora thermophila DSM 19022]